MPLSAPLDCFISPVEELENCREGRRISHISFLLSALSFLSLNRLFLPGEILSIRADSLRGGRILSKPCLWAGGCESGPRRLHPSASNLWPDSSGSLMDLEATRAIEVIDELDMNQQWAG